LLAPVTGNCSVVRAHDDSVWYNRNRVTGNCSVVRAHDDSVWYNRNRVGRQRSCAFILHPTVLYPPFGSPAHAFLQRMTPVALAPRESERPARLLTVSPHSASHARTAAAFASVRPGRWLVDLASPFFAHSAASVRFDIAITLSGRLRPNAAACRGHLACAELSCP
jgi:hypothetical protein